jgi:hypothetical protein
VTLSPEEKNCLGHPVSAGVAAVCAARGVTASIARRGRLPRMNLRFNDMVKHLG